MNAEIISIGDELTSGQRLDTNSQWLSQRLAELGFRVLYHTTVGDELGAMVRVFREAVHRAQIVIATGGLGPTADDLTRHAIAQLMGTQLVLDEDVLDHIRNLFARRNREMPEANVVQAQLPAGSRVIPNLHGTAPGIAAEICRSGRSASRIFALPGVPAEMREMWEQTVEHALIASAGDQRRRIHHHSIKCFGVGESDLEQMLPDLIQRGRQPSVGITVSQATITLRLSTEGETAEACDRAMQPTVETIHQCLGDLVFGEGDDELQDVVVRLLTERSQSLATVEWGTGGLVASWLSAADGGRATFLGGIVLRNESVPPIVMAALDGCDEQHQASKDQVVAASAIAYREQFAADYCLGIGPIENPSTERISPGVVHCALAGSSGVGAASFALAGHPDIIKPRAGKQALNLLRLTLLDKTRIQD